MDISYNHSSAPPFTKSRGKLSPAPTNIEKLTGSTSTPPYPNHHLQQQQHQQQQSLNLRNIDDRDNTSNNNINSSSSTLGDVASRPPPNKRRIRWAMLAAACLVMFGNYYAFDNPAALNKPLQEYMGQTDDQYAYFLNLLYTSYSIPNIILPWIGGLAADRFGLRKMLLFLSIMVVIGQAVVCWGLERRNVAVMILGRILFGAAETLSVAQSAITVKYFRGKELAMALGVNLCVSRLGSVLNDILSPYIWSKSSVPLAFWGGFVSCVLSMVCAFTLVWLDKTYGDTSRSPLQPLDRSHPTNCMIDTRVSFDSGLEVGAGGLAHKESVEKQVSVPSIKEITEDCLLQHHGDQENHQNHLHPGYNTRRLNTTDEDGPKPTFLGRLFDYSLSFWILFSMALLLIGVIVPFNSIHAGFLQMRWYPGDPQKAAQIMTVPDLLSAVLVLPVGYFVDHYGQKSWLFILCGLIIGTSHVILGIAHIPTPVPVLVALGISSAIGAIFSSAIPVLVKSYQISTA
ncbi:hypothetical protein BGZ83_001924 [Gryganskiella cystojenkinii]|nr:hypothetical protein BGZ83_001924 [Gryganskiella cystojenkinii]